jgi:predicted RNase H-like HicB family nuclease
MRFTIYENLLNGYSAVIEKCDETGLYAGYVPGFPGAHSQGYALDE